MDRRFQGYNLPASLSYAVDKNDVVVMNAETTMVQSPIPCCINSNFPTVPKWNLLEWKDMVYEKIDGNQNLNRVLPQNCGCHIVLKLTLPLSLMSVTWEIYIK